MVITYEEYTLLRVLNAEPTATYASLSRLFGTSIHTIKRRINTLKDKGLYNGYYAVYDPASLGFTRFFVFFYLDSINQYPNAELALDLHPYTIHRARFYSPQLGIFAQFDYPSKNPSLLAEFFVELKNLGIISAFSIVTSLGLRLRQPPDFKRFEWNTLVWSYEWEQFKSYITSKSEVETSFSIKEPVISQLKPIDLELLKKLTYDAEINQRELSREMDINRTTMWRRIKFLQDNVISGYNAKIDRSKFNLTANALILFSYHGRRDLFAVFDALQDQEIRPPFRYHVEIAETPNDPHLMLVYLSLPPHHEAQLIYTLADLATFNIYNLDVSGNHSIRYAFYPGNFDWENKKWKDDEEYVLKQPIEQLTKKMKNN